MHLLVFLSLFTLWTLPALADNPVYRWKDDQGSTHFSTKPPQGVQVELVNLNAQPVAVTGAERVYTWKDDEGNIHYGDNPPANQQAQALDGESINISTIRAGELRTGERQLLNSPLGRGQ